MSTWRLPVARHIEDAAWRCGACWGASRGRGQGMRNRRRLARGMLRQLSLSRPLHIKRIARHAPRPCGPLLICALLVD